MLPSQEPNTWDPIQQLKRKFAELIDESIQVETELSDLKRQKKEWKEERHYLINKLAALQNPTVPVTPVAPDAQTLTSNPIIELDSDYRYPGAMSSSYSMKSSSSSSSSSKGHDTIKFSPSIVAILDNWFTTHSDNPYPVKEEKEQLAKLTGLATKKVENWFINARRRRMKQTGGAPGLKGGQKNRNQQKEQQHQNNNNNNNNNNNQQQHHHQQTNLIQQSNENVQVDINDNMDDNNIGDSLHMNDDMLHDHSAIFENLPDFDGSNIL